jgi:phage tail-like protein
VRHDVDGPRGRNAVLVIRDAEGRPISRYHLESAWPSKVEISGLKAGASEVLYETVTLVCNKIERLNP